jgi:hypothetical protein
VGGCRPSLRDVVGVFGCVGLMRVCRELVEARRVDDIDTRITDFALAFDGYSKCVVNNIVAGSNCSSWYCRCKEAL